MRLNPNATATIVIGGLALCHRNRQANVWEVVFLRASDNFHNLKMKISNQPEVAINQGDRIAIKVTSPKSATDTYKPTPDFSRKKISNVVADARWILDFSSSELHNRPLATNKSPEDNFLNIPNAIFYTWNLSGIPYSVQKKQDGNSVGDPVEFEEIGQFMAGDIECNAGGSVSVEVTSQAGTQTFAINQGDFVFFDNRCPTGIPECAQDFHHYYDIIDANGETFELTSLPAPMNELQAQGLLGSKDTCEVGQIGDPDNPDDTLDNP